MKTVTTKWGETFNLDNIEKTGFWLSKYSRNDLRVVEDIGKLTFEIRFVSEKKSQYKIDPSSEKEEIKWVIEFIVDILLQLHETEFLTDKGFERNVDQILNWLTDLYNYETDSIENELNDVKLNKSNNESESPSKNIDSFLSDIDSVLKDIKTSSSSFHETNDSSEGKKSVRYPM